MTGIEQSPTVRRIVGPTILLHSGNYFDFLEPEACDFTIEDVAHGLSNVCRFAGQCRDFYSVAEHSVYVSQIVPPEDALAGLLHDAAEAFIGDVSKPLKDLLPQYREIEARIEAVVLGRFGLTLPLPASVKKADVIMLATEQRSLMRNRDDWDYCRGHEPLDMAIMAHAPEDAKALFIARYRELTSETDPDHGRIGPGHVCKHGIRWPHPCQPCDDAAYLARLQSSSVEKGDRRLKTEIGGPGFLRPDECVSDVQT